MTIPSRMLKTAGEIRLVQYFGETGCKTMASRFIEPSPDYSISLLQRFF